jgi:hypothetical protein
MHGCKFGVSRSKDIVCKLNHVFHDFVKHCMDCSYVISWIRPRLSYMILDPLTSTGISLKPLQQ